MAAAGGGGGGAVNMSPGATVRLRKTRGEKTINQLKEEAAEIVSTVAASMTYGASFHADILERGGKHAVELRISGDPILVAAAQGIAEAQGWRAVGRVVMTEQVMVQPYAPPESSEKIRRRLLDQLEATVPQPPRILPGTPAFAATRARAEYQEQLQAHSAAYTAAVREALAASRAATQAAPNILLSPPANFRRQNLMRPHSAKTVRNRAPPSSLGKIAWLSERYDIPQERVAQLISRARKATTRKIRRAGRRVSERELAERVAQAQLQAIYAEKQRIARGSPNSPERPAHKTPSSDEE